MLFFSYAIANNIKGGIRGLLGIYQITNDALISKSLHQLKDDILDPFLSLLRDNSKLAHVVRVFPDMRFKLAKILCSGKLTPR